MTPEQQPYNGPPRQSEHGPGAPSQSTRIQTPVAGISSHGSSRKRLSGANFDRSAYTAGQALVTVVNDPRADAAKNWGAWLGFRVPDVSWQDPPPPIDTMRYPPVARRDLAKYLALLSDGCYEQFQQARQSLALGGISQQLMTLGGDSGSHDDDDSAYGFPYVGYDGAMEANAATPLGDTTDHQSSSSDAGGGLGEPAVPTAGASSASTSNPAGTAPPGRPAGPRLMQGDGLVTALQVVPPLFFNEDFSLSRPDIFEAICGCEDDSEMYSRIDKLSAALDVVETQLMREIASRSRAIVAAGSCVHGLHHRLSATLVHIKRLREKVSDMDDVTYSAAVRVAALQRRRNHLVAAVERVRALEEVAAARDALPLLLESGDYAGALELLDNLSHAAAGLSASGVAAFRGLPPQLAESRGGVEALLASELLGAAIYTEAHLVMERAAAESAQVLGLSAATAPLRPVDSSGATSSYATGSSSLRADGSASSLLAAELAASREQLHDRLMPVVLGLHRCDRLDAALRQFATNRAAEVKAIVREVVERLLPLHLQMAGIPADGLGAGSGGGGGASGATATVAAGNAALVSVLSGADGGSGGFGGGAEMSLAEKLAVLPHQGFLQVLMVITSMVEAYLAHTMLVGSLVEDAVRSAVGFGAGGGACPGVRPGPAPGGGGASSAVAAALAAPRREVHAALQAVVDVATGRWAKLMAARSDVHSRLKVYEFRALLSACEAFAALPDSRGLRPGAALRPTLQALCRAHLENTHSRCAVQMQHLLEAEQWVPAQAHESFQAVVDRLEERCPGARQQAEQQQQQGITQAAAGQEQLVGARLTEGLLRLGGRHYWPVNSLLMLLKLLDEHYLGMLPAAAPLPQPQAGAVATAAGRRPPGPAAAAPTATKAGTGAGPRSGGGAGAAASWALSAVGPDVAQRCLELLRTFNTVTAQQVLGAGAMRTAGLKSISAKHLALAAQSLAALLAALPLLRWQLAAAIADAPRRALLMPEFDRLAQDLNLHVEEIHVKLVDIMQDRVLAACRQVASDADAWPRAAPSLQAQQAASPVPSEALRLLTKQLGTLRSVLQPILQPEEVSYIFGRVAAACSESLAGLLDSLAPPPPPPAAAPTPLPATGASGLMQRLGGGAAAAAAVAAAAEAHAAATAAWDASRRANALFMLQALAALPLDPSSASSYVTRLATFYAKHYGLPPTDAPARPPAPVAAGPGPPAATGPSASPPPPPPAAPSLVDAELTPRPPPPPPPPPASAERPSSAPSASPPEAATATAAVTASHASASAHLGHVPQVETAPRAAAKRLPAHDTSTAAAHVPSPAPEVTPATSTPPAASEAAAAQTPRPQELQPQPAPPQPTPKEPRQPGPTEQPEAARRAGAGATGAAGAVVPCVPRGATITCDQSDGDLPEVSHGGHATAAAVPSPAEEGAAMGQATAVVAAATAASAAVEEDESSAGAEAQQIEEPGGALRISVPLPPSTPPPLPPPASEAPATAAGSEAEATEPTGAPLGAGPSDAGLDGAGQADAGADAGATAPQVAEAEAATAGAAAEQDDAAAAADVRPHDGSLPQLVSPSQPQLEQQPQHVREQDNGPRGQQRRQQHEEDGPAQAEALTQAKAQAGVVAAAGGAADSAAASVLPQVGTGGGEGGGEGRGAAGLAAPAGNAPAASGIGIGAASARLSGQGESGSSAGAVGSRERNQAGVAPSAAAAPSMAAVFLDPLAGLEVGRGG